MPVFAKDVFIPRSCAGDAITTASGQFTDGKRLVEFQKAVGNEAKFFAIPDIRELFLVSSTRENLAARLRSLLRRHTQKHKKRRRHHHRRRRKHTRGHRQRRRGRHRTHRKGKRTRKK